MAAMRRLAVTLRTDVRGRPAFVGFRAGQISHRKEVAQRAGVDDFSGKGPIWDLACSGGIVQVARRWHRPWCLAAQRIVLVAQMLERGRLVSEELRYCAPGLRN